MSEATREILWAISPRTQVVLLFLNRRCSDVLVNLSGRSGFFPYNMIAVPSFLQQSSSPARQSTVSSHCCFCGYRVRHVTCTKIPLEYSPASFQRSSRTPVARCRSLVRLPLIRRDLGRTYITICGYPNRIRCRRLCTLL
jgi:hypothetical protein